MTPDERALRGDLETGAFRVVSAGVKLTHPAG